MDSNCLLLLLIIFSLTNVPQTQALTAPQYVRGEIDKEVVKVYWEHVEMDPSFKGYYVIVKDVGSKEEESPVYVHVDTTERCAKIIGLRPGSTYQLTVSAHSADTYKNSAPITIDTEKLEFLHADSLNVTDISNVSAMFEWTHVAKNNVHHIKFKLVCLGIQTFTQNGELMEERTLFKHESWSTSRGRETYTASGLLPNSRYTCHLVSVAGDRQSPSEFVPQVTFHTSPGRPSRPPRPRLSVDAVGKRTSDFSVELYPTDNQFGPIDHYEVVAVPVTRDEDQPRTLPYHPVIQASELLARTLSKELVTKVAECVPFSVAEYTPEELPPSLRISGKWVHKAFKQDTYYSFVVVAYTESEGSTELLSSISEPADPPVLIGHDEVREAVYKKRQVTRRFSNTIMATMFSILSIFAVAFIIVFGTKYYKGNKRDAYYFAVNEDSSSEEETVYIKKQPPKIVNPLLKYHKPLTPYSEGESKAEWAVKNVYFNPAFEEMVYRSPEMMQEMEDTMTMLAESRAGQTTVRIQCDNELPPEQQHQSLTTVTDDEEQEIAEFFSVKTQLEPIMPSLPAPLPQLTEAVSFPAFTGGRGTVSSPLATRLVQSADDLPQPPPTLLQELTDSQPSPIPGCTSALSSPPTLGYHMPTATADFPVSTPQQGHNDCTDQRPPSPPPPPPLPGHSTTSEGEEGSATAGEYTYKSLPCRPGCKNLFASPRTGLLHPPPHLHVSSTYSHLHLHTPSMYAFPPYYFVTLNPVPGASLEEYNVASSAFPLTTYHRLQKPPNTPPSMQQQRGKRRGL